MGSDYLSKLISNNENSGKRSHEESTNKVENPPKRRKMSNEIKKMRDEVDINIRSKGETSSLRNNIATMDIEKDSSKGFSQKNKVEKPKDDLFSRKKKKKKKKKGKNKKRPLFTKKKKKKKKKS